MEFLQGRISSSISRIGIINNASIKTAKMQLYIKTNEEASEIADWLTHINHTGI